MRGADAFLKELGEVVDDGVAASNLVVSISAVNSGKTSIRKRYLLHELGQGTEHHTAEVLRLSVGQEGLDRRALAADEAGRTDRVENHVAFHLGLLAVHLVAADGGDDLLGILVALVGEQPARALGQPDHGDAHDEAKHDLESNG